MRANIYGILNHLCPQPATVSIRVWLTAGILFLASPIAARADPVLVETAAVTGHTWLVLGIGLAIEAIILALFIRRSLLESLAVCFLANAVTGFIGFVVLLFLKLKGLPLFPLLPAAVVATVLEAPMIAIMLVRPPVKRVIAGTLVANLSTCAMAIVLLSMLPVAPPAPSGDDDLAMARNAATVRSAVESYFEEYGHFPEALTGGQNGDPLVESGILESYPANPYASSLRTLRFNPAFLIAGLGKPLVPVSLDRPTNEWEQRWFPLMKSDPRFGNPDGDLLCANGLSDPMAKETLCRTFYNMNGIDYIPGCFFYRAYDFDRNGLADDYVLGMYGWPNGFTSVAADIIDAATGEICLRLDSRGLVHPGSPDGNPEWISALYVAGT